MWEKSKTENCHGNGKLGETEYQSVITLSSKGQCQNGLGTLKSHI